MRAATGTRDCQAVDVRHGAKGALGSMLTATTLWDDYLLSFDLSSINLFVKRTRPKSCIHSDTMFPTTCPHLAAESIFR